ncbi:carnitine transporter [Dimargaris verticillata]|uniref:Carnitine transporter n=1 Tax=Dimargaris verticillata TaxID=2761393 RepID=A0A9W8B315_9FUNG|nr:carnitine transporter [Dimargaris verticillata]
MSTHTVVPPGPTSSSLTAASTVLAHSTHVGDGPRIDPAKESTTQELNAHQPSDSTAKSFIAGAAGGFGMVAAGHPFDLIKVRQQTVQTFSQSRSVPPAQTSATPIIGNGPGSSGIGYARPPSAFALFRQTFRADGICGLYRGVVPPLVTATPIVALSFWTYDLGLRFAERVLSTPPQPFYPDLVGQTNVPKADRLSLYQVGLAGALSGILPALVLGPGDRVKIIMQVPGALPPPPRTGQPWTTRQVVRELYTRGGLFSVFRGTALTIARDVPGNAFYFLSYEIMSREWASRFTRGRTDEINPLMVFLFGVEGITTLPIDTLKSRLQSAKHDQYPNGLRDVWRELMVKEGPRALFRGFTPTMMWSFPANAATFLCMELTYRFLNRTW